MLIVINSRLRRTRQYIYSHNFLEQRCLLYPQTAFNDRLLVNRHIKKVMSIYGRQTHNYGKSERKSGSETSVFHFHFLRHFKTNCVFFFFFLSPFKQGTNSSLFLFFLASVNYLIVAKCSSKKEEVRNLFFFPLFFFHYYYIRSEKKSRCFYSICMGKKSLIEFRVFRAKTSFASEKINASVYVL